MKKNSLYIILGVLAVLVIVVVIVQMNKSPSELSETGEEITNCGEGTVIYNDEDLCWQKSVSTSAIANWEAAKDYCENLELAGEDDWELPTTNNLMSIVDESDKKLSIDTEYFKDTKPAHYWTSSEYKEGFHWYIHFELGYQGFAPDFKEGYGVRCVRANTFF